MGTGGLNKRVDGPNNGTDGLQNGVDGLKTIVGGITRGIEGFKKRVGEFPIVPNAISEPLSENLVLFERSLFSLYTFDA